MIRALDRPKSRLTVLAAIVLLGLVVTFFANVRSSSAVPPPDYDTIRADATISADTAANASPTGSWTTVGLTILLPWPMDRDVLLDLAPPTGWQFDTTGAPTFTGNTCSFAVPVVTSTSISTRAAVGQQCNNPNTIAIAGVRVQPINGGTTATGNLTLTVTSSFGSATDPDVGTLTIVPGQMTKFVISNPTGGNVANQYEETAFSVLIRATDQFGTTTPSYVEMANLAAYDSGSPGASVPIATGGGTVGPFVAGEFSPLLTFENPHESIFLRATDKAFTGDANDFAVLSTALPTDTSMTAEPDTTYFGDEVVLVATVVPEPPQNSQPFQATPTGMVEFWANDTLLGTEELDEFGMATLTSSSLPLGFWTLHANYLGSDDYLPSSVTVGVVHTVIQANSITTIMAPALVLPGATFAISATVGPVGPATGTPTGWVVFYDGLINVGSGNLVDGAATLNTSLTELGPHELRADYQGNPRFLSSSSETTSVVVDTNATNLALTVTSTDPFVGQSVRFTATILPGNATGLVSFYEGLTLLGTGTLTGGEARFSTSALPEGVHVVTAYYPGDTISAAATSNSVTVDVQSIPKDEPPVVDDTVIPPSSTPTVVPPTSTPVSGTPTTPPTNPTTPPSAPTNTLGSPAPAGSTTIAVSGLTGFAIGDLVTLNPGGANEETLTISGLNPLTFTTPLMYSHVAGEKLAHAVAPATVEPIVPLPPSTGNGAASHSTDLTMLLYASGLTLVIVASGAAATLRKRR